jgi:hypothetical protein
MPTFDTIADYLSDLLLAPVVFDVVGDAGSVNQSGTINATLRWPADHRFVGTIDEAKQLSADLLKVAADYESRDADDGRNAKRAAKAREWAAQLKTAMAPYGSGPRQAVSS